MRATFPIFLFGPMLAIGMVAAQAQEQCEQFSVFSGTEDVLRHHMDHGPEGDSVGDRYIGHRPLYAQSGEVVGHEDWVFHVLHSMKDGETRIYGDWIMQFPAGEIFYKSAPTPTLRPLSGTGPLTPSEVPRLIIGGTGVFTGASGAVEYVRHEVGRREYVVKIRASKRSGRLRPAMAPSSNVSMAIFGRTAPIGRRLPSGQIPLVSKR